MQPFPILSHKWAVGADRLQWIVYRHRTHATLGGQWSALSYVASTKTAKRAAAKTSRPGPTGEAWDR
jgi:hypothetical protein